MSSEEKVKPEMYTRYPLSSLLVYNGTTILHFVLGGLGIIIGYGFSAWAGYLFGFLYLAFAFAEMYLLMPLTVCCKCVYYKLNNSLCISGLNLLSRRLTKVGDTEDFAKRAEGIFCSNNLYIAALSIPIIVIIPAFFINFSIKLLVIFILLMGLMMFRFLVIFKKIACVHCRAKNICPQAGSMGLRDQ